MVLYRPAFSRSLCSARLWFCFACGRTNGYILACIPLGMASITRLTTFRDYYAINKELLAGLTNQMDSTAQTKLIKQANEKKISADTSISSNRKGFEYLNELFIKRHKRYSGTRQRRFPMCALSLSPPCWQASICCPKKNRH